MNKPQYRIKLVSWEEVSAYLLGEEEYFVCCRCGKKHHAMEKGMTLDDVYFEWDFDTEKEYLEVFKKGEFQIH